MKWLLILLCNAHLGFSQGFNTQEYFFLNRTSKDKFTCFYGLAHQILLQLESSPVVLEPKVYFDRSVLKYNLVVYEHKTERRNQRKLFFKVDYWLEPNICSLREFRIFENHSPNYVAGASSKEDEKGVHFIVNKVPLDRPLSEEEFTLERTGLKSPSGASR